MIRLRGPHSVRITQTSPQLKSSVKLIPSRGFNNTIAPKTPYRDCVDKARVEITQKHADDLERKLSRANELLYKYANKQRLTQQDICVLNELQYYHRKNVRTEHDNTKKTLEYQIIVLRNQLKQTVQNNQHMRNMGDLSALSAEYEIENELKKTKTKLRNLETMSERELMSSCKF